MKLPDLDKGQILRHTLFAIVMGGCAALGSIVLCLCINFSHEICSQHQWLLFCLPLPGFAGVGLYKLLKLSVYLDTADVIRDFRHNTPISATLAPGILLGTCLTVLGGGSVGKESAALQMGASIGETISKPFKLRSIRRDEQDHLQYGYAAATGMAATFAALFFTPIGASFFVWELSRFRRSIFKHLPTMLLASFIGAGITSTVGIGDIIERVPIPEVTLELLLMAMLIGLVSGVLGAAFGTALRSLETVSKEKVKHPLVSVLIGGVIFVLLVNLFGWTSFEGPGGNLLAGALKGNAGELDFAIKALLTLLCLGFCFKGGEIMPMFTIGALLGCTLGNIAGIPTPFAAMLGLVTFFAGATRCPLAAFFMGVEIFGLAAAPYLLVAVTVATYGSHDFGAFGAGTFSAARKHLTHKAIREGAQTLKSDIQNGVEPTMAERNAIQAAQTTYAKGSKRPLRNLLSKDSPFNQVGQTQSAPNNDDS